MKTIHIYLILAMFLLTSCVSRTLTEKPVGGDNLYHGSYVKRTSHREKNDLDLGR